MRAEDEAVPMVNITFFTHDTALDVGGAMAKHYKHADEARTHTRTHRACTHARVHALRRPSTRVRSCEAACTPRSASSEASACTRRRELALHVYP